MILPTGDTLNKAVQSYVAAGSGLHRDQVIRGNQTAPAPLGPYASVLLITDLEEGFVWTAEARGEQDRFDVSVFESTTVEFSVQFYREGAHDFARRFRTWCKSPLGIEAAERRNLTFYRTAGARQLDDVVSSAWEPRASVDLTLGIVSTLVDAVDSAGSLDIDLCYDGQPEMRIRLETPT